VQRDEESYDYRRAEGGDDARRPAEAAPAAEARTPRDLSATPAGPRL